MIESGLKIRHLRCFREVLRYGSVKSAADVLSISQPAVSKTLTDLEALLGVRLLNRTRNGITPTRAGAELSEHVEEALASVRRCIDSVNVVEGSQRELIRIGILPATGGQLIPMSAQIHRAEHPNHDLRIISASTPDLVERLRLGELDFVIGNLLSPSQMTGLSFEYLYSERIVFVVRSEHPFMKMKPFDLQRLHECTVLIPSSDSIIFSDVERFLLSKGIGPLLSKIETASHLFGRSFTRMTDAVWITSEGGVAPDVADGLLGRLHIETPDTASAVGLTSRSSPALTPAVKSFMNVVRQVNRDISNLGIQFR